MAVMYLWPIIPIAIIWTSVVSVDTTTIEHAINPNNQFSTEDHDDIQSIIRKTDVNHYKSDKNQDDVLDLSRESEFSRGLRREIMNYRRSLGRQIKDRVRRALSRRFVSGDGHRRSLKYPSIIRRLKLKPFPYLPPRLPSHIRNIPIYGRTRPGRTHLSRFIPPNILPISMPYHYPPPLPVPLHDVSQVLNKVPSGLLPSEMPRAPYSVSYNDGKSSWNININPGTKMTRRSLTEIAKVKPDKEDAVETSWEYCHDRENCVKSSVKASWNKDD